MLALVACVLVTGSCRPDISEDSPLGARVSLTGAGAGFPAMLYQSWAIALYTEMPELKINYQSMGSGAGVKQVIKGDVDFGGSDVAIPTRVHTSLEGTLIVDAYDPVNQQLVWRGSGVVTVRDKPEKRNKQIDNILKKLGKRLDKILHGKGK
jgi:ABC-type phosphate transport system substrate-binding protein